MGGTGSGRVAGMTGRGTVEESRVLDLTWMVRSGLLDPGSAGEGTITWKQPHLDRITLVMRYRCNRELQQLKVEHADAAGGPALQYPLDLTTTPLPWGGRRWWLRCGLLHHKHGNAAPCGRRVAKLYLPRGRRFFGCRHCHQLTYQSCRDSRVPNCVHRQIAANMQITPERVMQELTHLTRADRDAERLREKRALRRARRRVRGWA